MLTNHGGPRPLFPRQGLASCPRQRGSPPWYADQVLPFDVTLTGTNEMGAATAMRIFGVEILNSGNGTSIDDTVNESQATFVVRFVEPWQAVGVEVYLACCPPCDSTSGLRAAQLGLFFS